MPPLLLASSSSSSPALAPPRPSCRGRVRVAAASAGVNGRAGGGGGGGGFPGFLPAAVERIRDEPAIRLAKRIERVPVQASCCLNPSPPPQNLSKMVYPLMKLMMFRCFSDWLLPEPDT